MSRSKPEPGSPETSLVEVTANHLAEIVRLNQAAVPAVNSVSLQFFELYADANSQPPVASAPPRYFKVALDSHGSVLGFLLALRPGEPYDSVNYRWHERHFDSFLYVDRIVVAPGSQGLGLGRIFYQDLMLTAQLDRPPTKHICCEVNVRPCNQQSLRFHQRFGFEVQGEQDTEGGAKRVRLLAFAVPTSAVPTSEVSASSSPRE